ncbi:hypothetical protein [Gryllotalpicola koreensis]|uniref:Membrane protein n=1 Tax=Gryllotalpicola koreensis TaxID=993086 RepID=A0ABP7ZZC5_9MICO
MTDTAAPSTPTLGTALRRLYFTRFAFAIVWALVLFATSSLTGPVLTVLLVLYPLVDAAAVAWQLRAEGSSASPRIAEWINVVTSVAAAIALGIASASSIGAVLAVWGIWAVVSGAMQLVTALLRRRAGGQVPLVISGAISVLAGFSFALQGLRGATSATSVGGYAILGGIFFLISAIRLSILLRRKA